MVVVGFISLCNWSLHADSINSRAEGTEFGLSFAMQLKGIGVLSFSHSNSIGFGA